MCAGSCGAWLGWQPGLLATTAWPAVPRTARKRVTVLCWRQDLAHLASHWRSACSQDITAGCSGQAAGGSETVPAGNIYLAVSGGAEGECSEYSAVIGEFVPTPNSTWGEGRPPPSLPLPLLAYLSPAMAHTLTAYLPHGRQCVYLKHAPVACTMHTRLAHAALSSLPCRRAICQLSTAPGQA